MTRPQMLLVEDDPSLADLLVWHFERQGFEIRRTADGEEAWILADEQVPDVIVLDWMIDGISGLELCRRLRRNKATAAIPIVMLTARGDEADRVRGLETGADDYVTKPFSPRELVARVNALLRRTRPALAGAQLSYGGIEMDLVRHRVMREGRRIALGPTESKLLRHLLESPERVFSRERLLDQVWSRDTAIDLRTVDVHVRRLRRALNEGGLRDLIRTVRSEGYSLDAEGA
ncbi:MAG TPA: phosphate regulon transcriptional regulator PhoB [Allosphingosinicella sp.]|nr:phosphate regulon transcriptional regulator PhoB [Allosphingosinicella sp.]